VFLNFNLVNRLVLVVGVGRVGLRKLKKVLAAGAKVRLVEPRPGPELRQLVDSECLELWFEFTPELLIGVNLVFVATSDNTVNLAVAEAAHRRGLWVNVVDAPERSDFFLPAVIMDRGNLEIAVTTGGGSPALAVRVVARLKEIFGSEYTILTYCLASLRPLILASNLSPAERAYKFRSLAESEELRFHLAQRRWGVAREKAAEILAPLTISDDYWPSLDLIDEEQIMCGNAR
jgi:siroheme synthase-like protein